MQLHGYYGSIKCSAFLDVFVVVLFLFWVSFRFRFFIFLLVRFFSFVHILHYRRRHHHHHSHHLFGFCVFVDCRCSHGPSTGALIADPLKSIKIERKNEANEHKIKIKTASLSNRAKNSA